MPEVAVVIPAGGVGSRFGARTPKQFLRLGTMPILAATVQHFARHPAVRAVVVAAPEPWVTRAGRILGRVVTHTPLTVVAGGRTRQDSVWLALQAAPEDVEIIVVHDAVRPMITRRLVDTVVRAAAAEGAAICALPLTETVKRVRAERVEATLDRSELWAVQTPQAFRADLLREAHEKARRDGVVGTDDAMLVERLGHPVRVVRGLAENVKITTPEDLRRARFLAGR
ncbi:MAG: 2-C-methyl-D-erythritol 4-phosphate cytidylyltransferase [Candidatus Rokuibacteriota bacterium]|nr:MAG: 2-C-methyl-D-erythritol 4-phosphate cytidylyltransferase [Candidatus Rokubacteria bacterium 13_2_20CM_69_15_1]OLB51189.1 MAG: 2-C-methyl-D-erythritol 4-phosphate cytidylyltransferase [Candidatus Rokubacteria bacterium 13_2_20CM_2_70_11]PYN35345.1 MAG: 2-C-methyl-D-erythritol 4-phosphate cytidylyltransferase [Candidatus Rokubacteria bacterium]